MLIAVYFDDKPLFDGLYKYWTSHVATNGLMTWCIPAGGGSCSASGGTATDADEDAAFAMLMASKQWPSGGYGGTATTLINAVMSTDMSGTYIKAGSNYSASQITNPSYFAPGVLPRLRVAWNAPRATTRTRCSTPRCRAAAMVSSLRGAPADRATAPASNGGADDMIYQYDSHRIPWRIGLDYCWNGTAAAKTYLDKISGFFSGKASNGVGRVFDIYEPERHGDERRRRQLRLGHRHRGRRRDVEHVVLDVHERRLPAGARPPEPRRRSAIGWRPR